MLFKEFGGVDAFPICLDTKDPDEIVATVKAIAPTFGGINLEDISAPRCFDIEERLKATLDIPVFHDDQHGTAVVVLAALLNAVKLTGKRIEDLDVLIVGLGAAGIAVAKILLAAGVRHVIGCDSKGALSTDRRRLPGRLDEPDQALVRRVDERRAPLRRPSRRDRGSRPVRRPLRRARDARRGAREDGGRRDGLRDGQPDPGGHAGGGRAVRADHRHRALGLPEPDQQRPLLPGHLPRRARRPRARDHRGDEDGRRARHRGRGPRRRAARGPHHPVAVQPRRAAAVAAAVVDRPRATARRSPTPARSATRRATRRSSGRSAEAADRHRRHRAPRRADRRRADRAR